MPTILNADLVGEPSDPGGHRVQPSNHGGVPRHWSRGRVRPPAIEVDVEPAMYTHSADISRDMSDTIQTWLVERTYSDDEQNLIILVYATPDGERYHRKERALTSFTGEARKTYAAQEIPSEDLADVTDPATRERYATEATRMAGEHDPDDII